MNIGPDWNCPKKPTNCHSKTPTTQTTKDTTNKKKQQLLPKQLKTLRQTEHKIKWTVDDQYIFKNAFVHKRIHVFIYRHENMFIPLQPTESALNHIVVFIDVILQLKFVLEFTHICTYIHIYEDMVLVNGGETVCLCVMSVCVLVCHSVYQLLRLRRCPPHHNDPGGHR